MKKDSNISTLKEQCHEIELGERSDTKLLYVDRRWSERRRQKDLRTEDRQLKEMREAVNLFL